MRSAPAPEPARTILLKLPLNSYTIIDPGIDENLQTKYAGDSRVHVVKSNSLDALAPDAGIGPGVRFDCILIDGDHNWYTVFNELRLIRERTLLEARRVHLPPRC